MGKLIVLYIMAGVLSFFWGNITADVAALGLQAEWIAIVGKGLDALVKGIGLVGVSLYGITILPKLPGEKPPAEKPPES